MKAQSLFEPTDRSSIGAIGLMQLMPYTAYAIARETDDRGFRLNAIGDSDKNIEYGGLYLRRLLDYYHGNVFLVAAAYNAGPKIVDRWIRRCGTCSLNVFVEEIPYPETRPNVKKVVENYYNYHQIYNSPVSLIDPLSTPSLPAISNEIF